ncbi:MAG: DNA cytosine methyltransferase [Acidobacteriia bacterium]|nr:DNA cytosine methyltransferase [Terriglobia bacterium]
MRAIDFFCGAGGLTRGLLDAGISVIAGFDADVRCKETYERNNRPAQFYERDIYDISAADVWKALDSRRTNDLLIAGCAPCQPFSKHQRSSGRASGVKAGQRNPDATLLEAFSRLVEAIRPAQILIENVPGLAKVKGFSTYRRFLKMLRENSYEVAEGVLDAKFFGVPQTRRRYVLIATKKRNPSLPSADYGTGLKKFVTVREAIAHYPPIQAGQRHPTVVNHQAAVISETNLLRLRSTPHDGGDRRTWPTELGLKCHQANHKGHTDVYGRMAWDRPAPTLTGRCISVSNGRYGHPSQDRAISLREAASLQTFSDNYVFHGNQQHIAKQIGNAVPVKLGEALGRHILSLNQPTK